MESSHNDQNGRQFENDNRTAASNESSEIFSDQCINGLSMSDGIHDPLSSILVRLNEWVATAVQKGRSFNFRNLFTATTLG